MIEKIEFNNESGEKVLTVLKRKDGKVIIFPHRDNVELTRNEKDSLLLFMVG